MTPRILLLVTYRLGTTLWGITDYSILVVLFLLCLAAIAYYWFAVYATGKFFSQPTVVDPSFHPPISILRPICGFDSKTYENLASFCRQDYPKYQIIFGVQSPKDSSMAVVNQIIHDFPQVDIQVTASYQSMGSNLKVSNLAHALTKAEYDILLLADSDVYVEPDYLQHVIQPLSNPKVGVVTCLYRSLTKGWVATLDALSTTTEFHPGVLVSAAMEGIKFAMGQTIVIRRSVLEEIGGFAAIADYLADDFQLGYLPAQAGYEVVLSRKVVEHVLPTSTLMGFLQRQIRWMVGIRVSRPWGYAGLIFTYGTVASVLFLLATGGSVLGWSVLGVTWASRLFMAWFVGVKSLQDPVAKEFLWLVPVRDWLSFGLWVFGFWGDTVKWRDREFKLTRGGKLVPVTANLSASAKTLAS